MLNSLIHGEKVVASGLDGT